MTPGFLTAWLYRLRHSRRPDPFGGALGERLRADIDPLDRSVPEPRFTQNPYADRSPFRSLEETRDT